MFRDSAGIEELRLNAINIHTSATMAMDGSARISNAVENYRTALYQLLNTHDILDKESKLNALNSKMYRLIEKLGGIVDTLYEIASDLET